MEVQISRLSTHWGGPLFDNAANSCCQVLWNVPVTFRINIVCSCEPSVNRQQSVVVPRPPPNCEWISSRESLTDFTINKHGDPMAGQCTAQCCAAATAGFSSYSDYSRHQLQEAVIHGTWVTLWRNIGILPSFHNSLYRPASLASLWARTWTLAPRGGNLHSDIWPFTGSEQIPSVHTMFPCFHWRSNRPRGRTPWWLPAPHVPNWPSLEAHFAHDEVTGSFSLPQSTGATLNNGQSLASGIGSQMQPWIRSLGSEKNRSTRSRA